MTMAQVTAGLVAEAIAHETFFSSFLDRIPQHLILPPTEKDEEESAAARFYKVRSRGVLFDRND